MLPTKQPTIYQVHTDAHLTNRMINDCQTDTYQLRDMCVYFTLSHSLSSLCACTHHANSFQAASSVSTRTSSSIFTYPKKSNCYSVNYWMNFSHKFHTNFVFLLRLHAMQHVATYLQLHIAACFGCQALSIARLWRMNDSCWQVIDCVVYLLVESTYCRLWFRSGTVSENYNKIKEIKCFSWVCNFLFIYFLMISLHVWPQLNLTAAVMSSWLWENINK